MTFFLCVDKWPASRYRGTEPSVEFLVKEWIDTLSGPKQSDVAPVEIPVASVEIPVAPVEISVAPVEILVAPVEIPVAPVVAEDDLDEESFVPVPPTPPASPRPQQSASKRSFDDEGSLSDDEDSDEESAVEASPKRARVAPVYIDLCDTDDDEVSAPNTHTDDDDDDVVIIWNGQRNPVN